MKSQQQHRLLLRLFQFKIKQLCMQLLLAPSP